MNFAVNDLMSVVRLRNIIMGTQSSKYYKTRAKVVQMTSKRHPKSHYLTIISPFLLIFYGYSSSICCYAYKAHTWRPAALPCDMLLGLLEYLFFWRSMRASRCRSMSALWMLFRASRLLAATEVCRRSKEDDVNPPLVLSGNCLPRRPPLAARG